MSNDDQRWYAARCPIAIDRSARLREVILRVLQVPARGLRIFFPAFFLIGGGAYNDIRSGLRQQLGLDLERPSPMMNVLGLQ